MKIPSLGKGINNCPDCTGQAGTRVNMDKVLSLNKWKYKIICSCGRQLVELYLSEQEAIDKWNTLPKRAVRRLEVLSAVARISYFEYTEALDKDLKGIHRTMAILCTKCGGIPEIQTKKSQRGRELYTIKCRGCVFELDSWYYDKKSAIIDWNDFMDREES